MYQKKKIRQLIILLFFSVLVLIPFLTPIYKNSQDIRSSASFSQVAFVPSTTQTPTPIPTPVFNEDEVKKYLTVQAALLGVTDSLSLYMKDENSKNTVSLNSERSWIPASTIKAFVVLEAFRQRRAGIISFNQFVTIQAGNVVPTEMETDEFPILRDGVTVTIEQLLGAMVTQSDNTAYNTLLDILDRRNINSTLQSLGITETVVGEKLNLDDNQFANDLQVPGRRPNTTTAKDYATLFDLLYTNQVPDSEEILAIFKRQKINTMIPAYLPQDTQVAHKTGDLAPLYHDGGLIYKPSAPFVLTVYTNNNNQQILSKLAEVAYFQDVGVITPTVSKKVSVVPKSHLAYNRAYLASLPVSQDILGDQTSKTSDIIYEVKDNDTLWSIAQTFYGSGDYYLRIIQKNNLSSTDLETGMKLDLPYIPQAPFKTIPDKFPSITAQDLGINQSDLETQPFESKKIQPALITPASILYPVKILAEAIVLTLAPKNKKSEVYIKIATDRLSEAKAMLAQNNTTKLASLLDQSESTLKLAVQDANQASDKEIVLSEIKQVSDLHFSVLGEEQKTLTDKRKKEEFVDAVYDFYQKNQKEIKPVTNEIKIINPSQQQPVVGTVTKVDENKATVAFTDGTTKAVELSSSTKMRDFQATVPLENPTVNVGTKIAIIPQKDDGKTITPLFILRNVPSQIPDKREGIVIEVNPRNNTIEIQTQPGKMEEVQVTDDTLLKGRDTGISIEGIKPGSVITVYGVPQASNSASTSLLSPTNSPFSKNEKLTPSIEPFNQNSKPTQGSAETKNNSSETVSAKTVTVIQNGSGKDQKIEPAKPAPTSAPSKPAAPVEQKKQDKQSPPTDKKETKVEPTKSKEK